MTASDNDFDPGQASCESQTSRAGVDHHENISFDPGHARGESQNASVGVDHYENTTLDPGQPPCESQSAGAGVDLSGYDTLRAWAEMYYDTQQVRIQIGNRIKANERRGITIPALMLEEHDAVKDGEHRQELALRRQYRATVPPAVIAWQKASVGIGELLLARLLGHLGHPVIARPHHWEGTGTKRHLVPDPPYQRTVSQLWQYCGHGNPGRPWPGITADELSGFGSPICKTLVHLIAEAACRHTGDDLWPYRNVYDDRRVVTAERIHTAGCPRCGPKGHPAQPGTPWKPGHQHADAHRVVGKHILADLWKAAQ